MAITVGTDTYVTVAEADTYFAGHLTGSSAWSSATTEQKEHSLRQAARDIDAQYKRFIGTVYVVGQALEWPRYGIVDRRGEQVAASTVPDDIKRAQYEQAFHVLDAYDAPNTANGPFVSGEVLPDSFTPELSDTARTLLWPFFYAPRVVRG